MNKRMLALLLLLPVPLSACGGGATPPPLAGAKMGGAFALTNQDGKRVTDRDFAGRYRIVYFGYTFCPDVCPTDMQVLSQGLAAFEKADAARAGKVSPIFISIDPARDSPAAIKEFLANFHPRFTGLTGSVAEIDAVAKAYAVPFQRETPNQQGGYLVNHANMAVLYGPGGDPIALLPQDGGAAAVAKDLDRWVR